MSDSAIEGRGSWCPWPLALTIVLLLLLAVAAASIASPPAEARSRASVSLTISADQADLGQKLLFSGCVGPNRKGETIGRSVAHRYDAVPVAFASDGALIVAMGSQLDSHAINDIEEIFGHIRFDARFRRTGGEPLWTAKRRLEYTFSRTFVRQALSQLS